MLPEAVVFTYQGDGDLGERMARAARRTLEAGRPVLGIAGAWLTFDAAALGGRLPDHAGLVVTDVGAASVTVEGFDARGVSLGSRTAAFGGAVTSDVAEDRFFGFASPLGVSRIEVRAEGGLEIDHLQYGLSDGGIGEKGGVRRGR